MKQLQFNALKQDSKIKQSLVGFVVLVALIVTGVFLYSFAGDFSGFGGGISRGGVYEELALDHPNGEKYLDLINKAYDRLDNEDPDDDTSAFIDLGFYKNELGDTKGSIKAYKAGLELKPTNELILSNLAHVYENLKDYKNAERYYRKLVEVNPRNTRGIMDFASMYRYYFDDKHDAIVDLVEVKGLAVNPNNPNLLIFLANYYRNDIEDLEKSEIFYRQILELDPNNTAVRVELLNLLRSQGRSL